MRKLIVLFLLFGLVFGAVAQADAKKKKKKKPKKIERTVEGAYDLPPLVLVGTCAQTGAIGCVSIPNGPDEVFVTKAKVEDAHGQPVAVSVSANLDGEIGDDVTYGVFCGELTEPIVVDPGVELHFWVGAATDVGVSGCVPGAATNGTISITLSNLP